MDEQVLRAGILVGGASRRMGRPKAALPIGDETLAGRIAGIVASRVREVVLLGAGPAEVGGAWATLADAPGVAGPLGGILAALREFPDGRWLIVATDMPRVSLSALDWLLGEAGAGRIAVLPRRGSGIVEPLFAVYETAARTVMERLVAEGVRGPHRLADEPGVHTPTIPVSLESAWMNVNTPAEWAAVRDLLP